LRRLLEVGVARDTLGDDTGSELGVDENGLEEEDLGNKYSLVNVSIGRSRELWIYTCELLEEDDHWSKVDTENVDGSGLNFYRGETGMIELVRWSDEETLEVRYSSNNEFSNHRIIVDSFDEVDEIIGKYNELDEIKYVY